MVLPPWCFIYIKEGEMLFFTDLAKVFSLFYCGRTGRFDYFLCPG